MKVAAVNQKKKQDPREDLKLAVAAELGLLDKVQKEGWSSLTARESGRIGGYITRYLQKGIDCHRGE
ncbi:MAG TPA: small, acid-soluble spore protein, alpha/beta type [Firmicutes bacterium]|jgi:hypothetical protein|nr:small, acid-soluble spore protein, alpha/beta type [Bacillota bacterium]